MPFFQIIILMLLVFGALIFALRYILTRNIGNATAHLEEMSREYTAKQTQITKLVKDATDEAESIKVKTKKEVEELRDHMLKDAKAEKEKILEEAHQKSGDMLAQAERTCEFLKKEIEQQVEQKALEKAATLLQMALPKQFREDLHNLWMEEAKKTEFHLERLNLKEGVKEAQVVSSFPLSAEQQNMLEQMLAKKIGPSIKLVQKVDPELLAGLIITVGNVVIDGTLKDKVQKAIKQHK